MARLRTGAALLLLAFIARSFAMFTDTAANEDIGIATHSRGRRLREILPFLPSSFDADWGDKSPGQTFRTSYYMYQGQSINFTFAQSDYVPSTGFTVNATMDRGFSLSAAVDRAPGPPPRLQLYCAPGVGNVINSSAPLPSQASAVGSTVYTNTSAVLVVNTTRMEGGSLGGLLEGRSRPGSATTMKNFTEDGLPYSRPITCVIQYGNSSSDDAPALEKTFARLFVRLTVRYPQPTMVQSEQAAIGRIYSQCCNSTEDCLEWKHLSSVNSTKPFTDFCEVPGNVCHSNGTLAVLDTRQLKLYCHFPYPELAAFKSLNSLSLEFCRPVLGQLCATGCCRTPEKVNSAPVSATGTWADFFANLASLKALQTLSISGSNSFNGTLLPQQLVPGQATICDLARARLGYLKIGDPLAGSQTLLNGTLPACLIDSQSQLRTLSIAATNLTGIEKPTRPSGKLVEFSYNRNRATFGDIPEQLGGLSNLTRLLMTYNGFNGSIPGTLGNLTSMKHLLLCCQRLSGTVSANLARSPKLETLDLSFNALTGSVPASIGTSLSLKEATLFSNNFSGSLPAFSAYSQLQRLQAFGNNISGPLPPSLMSLNRLLSLQLYRNKLTGTLPAVRPGALQNMTDIDISHNRISGPLNATWDALPSLATLDASHNALNGSLPLSLFRAPALTALLLQANSLSGALPVPQGNLSKLERINLGNNSLSGNPSGLLCGLPGLLYLNISFNHLNGSLQDCTGIASNLSTLDMGDNMLTGSIPRSVIESMPKLVILQAADNNFSGPLPVAFNSNLTILDFTNNSFTGILPQRYGKLTYMRQLWLGDNFLTGSIPAAWEPLADPLVLLSLRDNYITGVIPANLTRKIPVLELQNNWFNVTPSSWFGSRAYTGSDWYLIRADMSGNNLTGLFPDGLAKQAFKPVKYLDVSGNQLSGPLTGGSNASAPFFPGLVHFNASFNNLTGGIPGDFARSGIFNGSSTVYLRSIYSGPTALDDLAFDVRGNQLSGDIPDFLSASTVPPPLQTKLFLLGNSFTCPSTQDKAYLNLTSCAVQSAGSAGSPQRGRAGLSKGGIAGIVIGVICGLGVAAAGLALLLLHRRRRGQQGWQKESLDGPPIVPGRARAPGIELAHSKSDAPA